VAALAIRANFKAGGRRSIAAQLLARLG
jgi:hypothetical protein